MLSRRQSSIRRHQNSRHQNSIRRRHSSTINSSNLKTPPPPPPRSDYPNAASSTDGYAMLDASSCHVASDVTLMETQKDGYLKTPFKKKNKLKPALDLSLSTVVVVVSRHQ